MRLSVLAVFTLCASSLAAHADSLIYNVNATFSGGASITGTVTLDNTLGTFTAANLTDAGFAVGNGSFARIIYQGNNINPNGYTLIAQSADNDQDQLVFNLRNFVGYSGSTIPVYNSYLDTPNSGTFTANSTAVTLQTASTPPTTAVTPEPSGLVLLQPAC